MAFTQIESDVWVVEMVRYMLTVLVEGGFLKRLSMNVKSVGSGGQEKVMSQVSRFLETFRVNFITFICKVVG